MTITLRSTKGSRLTNDEIDANFTSFQASDGTSLVGFSHATTYAQGTVGLALQSVINVKNAPYNAVGDGVTDDTAAIQAALTAAVALQTAGIGGGSGGCVVWFPRGIYQHTALTLAPASGVMSVSLIGEGRGTGLRYTGAGGTALTIKNNNNYEMRGFYMVNAGSGTTTGLALQSVSAGSSSSLGQPGNLLITGFTTPLQIGSSGDLAASEMLCRDISIQNCTTGVAINGASPSTNSINIHFDNVHVLTATTAYKFSGDTTSENNLITFSRCSANSCNTDFDFQSPAHVSIRDFHTEGNTAGWKFINTAEGGAACPPMFMEIEQLNFTQATGADSVIHWPGTYNFNNVDLGGLSLDVGDAVTSNRYQIETRGRDIPIVYAAGSQSIIYVGHFPAANSQSNNQSVKELAFDMYQAGGTKTTVMSIPWNASPPRASVYIANGAAATPALSFVNATTDGLFIAPASAAGVVLATAGTGRFRVGTNGGVLRSDGDIRWSADTNIFEGSGADCIVVRDGAAGALAQKIGNVAQSYGLYANHSGASNYQRSVWKSAKTTLSGVSGATITATTLIPDGAYLIGVTTRVNTGLGVSNGTTGYAVGDASDPNLWGDVVGTAAGTASGSTGFTATWSNPYLSATNVLLSAATGNFDGTGVIEVTAHYMICEAD